MKFEVQRFHTGRYMIPFVRLYFLQNVALPGNIVQILSDQVVRLSHFFLQPTFLLTEKGEHLTDSVTSLKVHCRCLKILGCTYRKIRTTGANSISQYFPFQRRRKGQHNMIPLRNGRRIEGSSSHTLPIIIYYHLKIRKGSRIIRSLRKPLALCHTSNH